MKLVVAIDADWPRERNAPACRMASKLSESHPGSQILIVTIVAGDVQVTQTQETLQQYQETIAPGSESIVVVAKTTAGVALVEFCKSFAPHMLLVGTRLEESSSTLLEKLLIGSTSTYVLANAPCVVLIAR